MARIVATATDGPQAVDQPTAAGVVQPAPVIARPPRESGGGGIRTRGPVARTPVFKTGAFNRSATPPGTGETIVAVRPRGAPRPARCGVVDRSSSTRGRA